eukprot:COSAG06_NODE_544_length_14458_cov_18.391671_4_plen_331_part_00
MADIDSAEDLLRLTTREINDLFEENAHLLKDFSKTPWKAQRKTLLEEHAEKTRAIRETMEPRSELSLDGTVRMTLNQAGPIGILLHTGTTEVKSLREGSQAALAGKVETGSTLSSIETNGRVHDVSKMSYQATMEVLQRGDRPITLSFRLPKSEPVSWPGPEPEPETTWSPAALPAGWHAGQSTSDGRTYYVDSVAYSFSESVDFSMDLGLTTYDPPAGPAPAYEVKAFLEKRQHGSCTQAVCKALSQSKCASDQWRPTLEQMDESTLTEFIKACALEPLMKPKRTKVTEFCSQYHLPLVLICAVLLGYFVPALGACGVARYDPTPSRSR